MTMTDDMMMHSRVFTFYSFKGGTGRTMALANTAVLLGAGVIGRRGRVLAIDWDLEAPGLHRYLVGDHGATRGNRASTGGVIDLFSAVREVLSEAHDTRSTRRNAHSVEAAFDRVGLERHIMREVAPGVDFMPAGALDVHGRLSDAYPESVSAFTWSTFFETFPTVFDVFRDLLAAEYAYVLIDSRTGLNDASGICTMILPERLIGVFTPNSQSVEGLAQLFGRAIAYRAQANDMRPLAFYPLASRVEENEQSLREEWRARYQRVFEDTFRRGFDLESCDLQAYFDEVQLPYRGYFAYGEELAVRREQNHSLSLHRAYERFVQRLLTTTTPWDTYPSDQTGGMEPSVDTARARRVYLSYPSDDSSTSYLAALVEQALRRFGLEARSLESGLRPGQRAEQAVGESIAGASLMLYFVRATASSRAQRFELAYAVEQAVPVIPVLLGTEAHQWLPESLLDIVPIAVDRLGDPPALLAERVAARVLSALPAATRASLGLAEEVLESFGIADRLEGEIRTRRERVRILTAQIAHLTHAPLALVIGARRFVMPLTDGSMPFPAHTAQSPTSTTAAQFLADRFELSIGDAPSVANACQLVQLVAGRRALDSALRTLASGGRSTMHGRLVELVRRRVQMQAEPLTLVMGTLDTGLEVALTDADVRYETLVSVAAGRGDDRTLARFLPGATQPELVSASSYEPTEAIIVFKPYGDLVRDIRALRESHVVTEDDHLRWYDGRTSRAVPRIVREARPVFLDLDSSQWTDRALVRRLFHPRAVPGQQATSGWAINAEFSLYEELAWKHMGVETFAADVEEFLDTLAERWMSSRWR